MKNLPETKLAELIDFASYLLRKEKTEELLRMQTSSKAYQEWLLPENDIYDELFQDDIERDFLLTSTSLAS
ncbi:hypothetical protein U27_06628 [Candidatus Vecturithrix granuli]|uniref:DUF2281 domain-containing protein n=1 Tax=Vecturithrix granuli TaxID=1499967 RepID=A0A081C4Y8_VECG1|nr:hypothetical protein U27_06628 [Candidatus Vecturithrix granuli]